MMDIAAAKAGFDMRHGDFPIIGGETSDHGGQRIAMDDYPVGLFRIECPAEFDDKTRGKAIKRLVFLHDVQIDVRDDTADLENLIEQAAMLGGDTDTRVDMRSGAECMNHGKQLDGFRPGPEYDDYLHPAAPY
jgi:hypothetical protein